MEEWHCGAEGLVRSGEYLAVDLAGVSVAALDERVLSRPQIERMVWEQLRPCGEIVSRVGSFTSMLRWLTRLAYMDVPA